jgi:MoaA/NifB/PqqE/SkfB family radical SAM enzyme
MNIEELKSLINNRDVYIWGTRISGLSATKILPKYNIEIKSFVDSIDCNPKLGLKVISPEELFKIKNKFIIICTRSHSPKIIDLCKQNNLEDTDYIVWEKLQKFDYYIEINNRCNLSCITCSVREYYNEPYHNMSVEDFKKALNKIRDEDPFVSWINLFGHNEAFLNDSLSEMIKISNDMNFSVGLSTNLAFSREFKDVIKANPLWIRVSMSGWGTNYELIHRGGKFDVLLKNLNLLSKYRKEYSPETLIEVFLHRYRHNEGDIEKVKSLCDSLGFEFRCIYASIIGFETVTNILDNRPISRKTQNAMKYLCYSVEETAKLAFKQKDSLCPNDHTIRIHSDLSVAECQAWMGSKLKDVKFTEISFENLEYKLSHTKFCPICKPRGLHQYCEVVYTEENQ